MKPYVICHMVSSVDGRILSSRWRPKGVEDAGAAAPVRSMTLESSQVLEGGAVWLRYQLQSG